MKAMQAIGYRRRRKGHLIPDVQVGRKREQMCGAKAILMLVVVFGESTGLAGR
jgi:hypothetical protein